jgi:hypothetical protein
MQSSQLQDFLSAHYAGLAARETEMSAQLEAVRAEMERVRKAAEAAGVELHESPAPNLILRCEPPSPPRANETMKEAALAILENEPRGLLANQILEKMNKRLGTEYARSSLSPQLSRLKDEKKIELFKDRWILPRYVTTVGSHRVLLIRDHEDDPQPGEPEKMNRRF